MRGSLSSPCHGTRKTARCCVWVCVHVYRPGSCVHTCIWNWVHVWAQNMHMCSCMNMSKSRHEYTWFLCVIKYLYTYVFLYMCVCMQLCVHIQVCEYVQVSKHKCVHHCTFKGESFSGVFICLCTCMQHTCGHRASCSGIHVYVGAFYLWTVVCCGYYSVYIIW